MNPQKFAFLIISLAFSNFLAEVAASCKGCVELDSLTFDKILSKFQYSIVKFDISYPYGEKHEQFEEFSKAAADVSELLVAEVGVKDYGDKDNDDLAQRFNVKTDKFPVIKLFDRQNVDNPIEFSDAEWTADTIRKFVRQNSNLYIGLAGCVREFDDLARRFAVEFDSESARQSILEESKQLATTFEGKKEDYVAKIYIAYMERIIERGGLTFVQAEKQRLKKVLEGKVSDTKKEDLKKRLNILESFVLHEKSSVKNEL
ncbi:protein windbeutel [Culicoides brevitarsis]|uniref:protein windbeutel n=1 Tax=Culicoides brevitarsis TaxID=469753 RepID=UPI00307B6B40